MRGKTGKTYGTSHAVQKRQNKHHESGCKAEQCIRETDLDVMQENRIDDSWTVDANRKLSDSWKGITKFTLLNGRVPKGYMWSGERLTKMQMTTRPDNVWPEVWTQIGKAAQKNEKNKNGHINSQT